MIELTNDKLALRALMLNPIWAGFWNDVVGWGGALSARVSVLEGSPLWQRVIFWNFSKFFFEPGTCLTSKETKSRNLVSVALSTWKRQTIFSDLDRKYPQPR